MKVIGELIKATMEKASNERVRDVMAVLIRSIESTMGEKEYVCFCIWVNNACLQRR